MKVLLGLVLGFSFLFSAVDINNANQKELMSIKGIGVTKAKAIITYRETHCFQNVNELQKVKGIGKKFLQQHKSELSAGSCKN
ncbi:helix-hairpin-helix domain-containing protein [Sulfurimonas sp. C5]|uniref:ComEA family DNA-binding protein n=1 Tax=Sulfurimonas sp. C5 TaxID=3036947 RepID=UPI00245490B4|nr:helix-hairpin-helix domain-containing protein [Sulfurimonas sp. C5]MDH4943495.1 helix-hairpin-helix domain-containing protein [Sulfurimonas sp. C5]